MHYFGACQRWAWGQLPLPFHSLALLPAYLLNCYSSTALHTLPCNRGCPGSSSSALLLMLPPTPHPLVSPSCLSSSFQAHALKTPKAERRQEQKALLAPPHCHSVERTKQKLPREDSIPLPYLVLGRGCCPWRSPAAAPGRFAGSHFPVGPAAQEAVAQLLRCVEDAESQRLAPLALQDRQE